MNSTASRTELTVASSAFTVTIRASTPIPAPPPEVWSALVATADYPSWNPFVRRLEGELEVGARLDVEIAPAGRRPMTLRPTVVEHVPGERFAWLGRLGVPGLVDGRHEFTVLPGDGGGSVLVQSERLVGALVPTVRALLTGPTPQGFVAMNEALRGRVASGRG